MIHTFALGDCRITGVVEYSAPTHDPCVLFPGLDETRADVLGRDAGETHYVASMRRLVITVQVWVVHRGSDVVLVDTGVGNGKTRALARMNGLNTQLPAWLEAAGATPDTVTHVVHTHLHADHVGWNTVMVDGRWQPTFPRARYLIPRLEYEHCERVVRDGGSPIIDRSFVDSVLPVLDAGLVDLIDPGPVAFDGLTAISTPGHSVGHFAYRLASGGESALFCGDVVHSPLQVADPTLNTSYCSDPDLARRTRRDVLAAAAAGKELLLPMHFGAPYAGRVQARGDGFAFEDPDPSLPVVATTPTGGHVTSNQESGTR